MTAATIARQLDDPTPEARRLAAKELPTLKDPEVGRLLLRALSDEDWRVRKEAASAAPYIERRAEVIAILVSALADRDDIGLRNAAVEALAAIGADATLATVESLARLDADGRKLAVEVLAKISDAQAVRALIRALADDDVNVRATAAEALAGAAAAGEESRSLAVDALTLTLKSSELQLRISALDSLTKLGAQLPWRVYEPLANDPLLRRHVIAAVAGSRDRATVAALANALADTSLHVAREAVVALGDSIQAALDDDTVLEAARQSLQPSMMAQEQVREFANMLGDPSARGAALTVLGLIQDPGDIPTLVDALGDEEVAERAEIGLQLFGEEAALPMIEASKSSPPSVRTTTLSMAPVMRPSESDVADALREALKDASTEVVTAALAGLGHAGDATDVERVAPFVLRDDARISHAAADALVALAMRFPEEAEKLLADVTPTSPRAALGCLVLHALGTRAASHLPFLRAALAHPDPRARMYAARALGQHGGAAALEAVSLAMADEERDVVLAAVRAFAKIETRPAEIVRRLSFLLEHARWEVRKVTIELLDRLGTPDAHRLLQERAGVEVEPVVRAALSAVLESRRPSEAGNTGEG